MRMHTQDGYNLGLHVLPYIEYTTIKTRDPINASKSLRFSGSHTKVKNRCITGSHEKSACWSKRGQHMSHSEMNLVNPS